MLLDGPCRRKNAHVRAMPRRSVRGVVRVCVCVCARMGPSRRGGAATGLSVELPVHREACEGAQKRARVCPRALRLGPSAEASMGPTKNMRGIPRWA
eukprot:6750279-Pyramimonas_sp.AAC.1